MKRQAWKKITGLAAKMPAMKETLSLVKNASVTPVPMTSASLGRSAARGWRRNAKMCSENA